MSLKVFILGRPGSGKTTAARYVSRLAIVCGLTAIHLNDYDILKQMFLADTEHLIFRPTENNGFDVRDFSTLEIALQKLNEEIEKRSATYDIITVEFARDDYQQALRKFDTNILRSACFLYLDADIETCLRRVHERVTHASSADDHPSISDELFKVYYRADHKSYMLSKFSQDFDISDEQVGIIENEGSYECFLNKTRQTLDTFLGLILSLSQAQGILTGPVSYSSVYG